MPQPHIQVILGDNCHMPPALQNALQRLDASTSFLPLAQASRTPTRADVFVLIAPAEVGPIAGELQGALAQIAERPRATLVLRSGATAMPPVPHPPTLPVVFAGDLGEEELAIRLTQMLELRNSLASLHQAVQTMRHDGARAARRFDHQLRLASRVQREFMPTTLPRYGDVTFSVLYRPLDYVSGDLFDIHRLDDEHVGFAIADASGHGIPAALLTVYIKRALRGKEIAAGVARLLSPDEVLIRLNDELLEAGLVECQFVAASYGIVNLRTRTLRIARGGTPYPLLRRADGAVRMLNAAGGVLGVLPGARPEVVAHTLQPGDSLLLYTDGLERLVDSAARARALLPAGPSAARGKLAARRGPAAVGVTCAPAARRAVAHAAGGVRAISPARAVRPCPAKPQEFCASRWHELLREAGPDAVLERFSHRYDALRRMGRDLDDLTMLCLKVDPEAECAA